MHAELVPALAAARDRYHWVRSVNDDRWEFSEPQRYRVAFDHLNEVFAPVLVRAPGKPWEVGYAPLAPWEDAKALARPDVTHLARPADAPKDRDADELRRPELGAVVAGMDDLLDDAGFKVQQLMYEPLPVALPDDELFAVVVYTYDNQSGEQPGNLYYELNNALRERSAQSRSARSPHARTGPSQRAARAPAGNPCKANWNASWR